MATKKIKIDLNYVHPGTTFIYPLYSEAGKKVLDKRTVLTKAMIEDLRNRYGHNVYYAKEVKDLIVPAHLTEKASEQAKEMLDEISHTDKISKESYKKTERVVESFLTELDLSEIMAINLLKDMKSLDDYLYHHLVNVGILTAIYLKKIGTYSDEEVKNITLGAYLIDIGMMKVDQQLVKKKGKFSVSDITKMKRHPQLGYEMLKSIKGIDPIVLQTVLFHHEKFNNKGYFHLPYNNLPVPPKIVSVCDSYDAFTSERPHRKSFSPAFALKILVNQINIVYDYKLIHDFINIIGPMLNNNEPFFSLGEFCELNTDEIGLIKEYGTRDFLKPKIFIFCKFVKINDKVGVKFLSSPIEVDLINDSNRTIKRIITNKNQIDIIRLNLLERRMLLDYVLEKKSDKN